MRLVALLLILAVLLFVFNLNNISLPKSFTGFGFKSKSIILRSGHKNR